MLKKIGKTVSYGTLIALYMSQTALAQVPPSASPSVIPRTNPSLPQQQNNEDQQQPTQMPSISMPAQSHAAQYLNQEFTLGGVHIVGMSVYSKDRFRALYADKIGHKIKLGQIVAVASAITTQYRNDGYVLSRATVPTQSVSGDGVITIRVIEGSVDGISVVGNKAESDSFPLIEEYAQKIQAEKPLTAKTLERYLLLINDLPGNTARAVLKASANGDGNATLVINIDHKTFGGLVDINNHSTPYLGPWQQSFTGYADSLLGYHERIQFTELTTSPINEERYGALQYLQPFGSEGSTAQLTFSRSRSYPGGILKPLQIEGNDTYLAATVQHPFIRSRTENLTGHITLDGRDDVTDLLDGLAQQNDTRVRSVRLGGTFDTVDPLSATNSLSAELSHGISWLDAANDGAGPSNGDLSYTKVHFDYNRIQPLPYKFSLLTGASGQYAFDPLVQSEQFLLGGAYPGAFGEAYDPGELSGDSGLAGRVELRYGDQLDNPYVKTYQFFGAYDIGGIWMKEQLAGSGSASLASLTGGLRLTLLDGISGQIEVADPLTKQVASQNGTPPRVFADFSFRF